MSFTVESVNQPPIEAILRLPKIHSGAGRKLMKHLALDVNGVWETSVDSDYEMPWDLGPWDDGEIPWDPWAPDYHFEGVYNPQLEFDNFISVFSTISTYETEEVLSYFDGGNDLSGSGKWWGGCMAESGMIYGIPYNDTRILKIDPRTNAVSFFGDFEGTAKWKGGVVGRNGKIYGVPHNSTSVLVINPSDDSTSLIEGLSESTGKWAGGVLGPDGYIYCCPDPGTNGSTIGSMLVIGPSSDIAFTRSSAIKGGGLALHPTGYAATSFSGGISGRGDCCSCINLDSGAETIDCSIGVISGYFYDGQCGAILAPNGNIYAPIGRLAYYSSGSTITTNKYTAKITMPPLTQTIITSKNYNGYLSYGQHAFSGGVLAPNGHIYCIPYTMSSVDRIDPTDDSIKSAGMVSSDVGKWAGGVLAPNGRIYCIPHNYNKILQISNVGEMNSKTVLLTHPFVNKF